MEKRGSHVGVILSLVIFITFLVFLYTVVEPLVTVQKDKESLLSYLETELTERVSSNLTTSSVGINKTTPQTCVQLGDFVNETEISLRLIVKDDETGEILKANISQDENDLFITKGVESVFFKVYDSPEFEELEKVTEISGCKFLEDEKDYSIGLIRTNEYLFESKIINLINEYGAGYADLKEKLKIPLGSEFGFSITYDNGTIIGTGEKNLSINVYAEEIPIRYVDDEANINFGFMNIKVW